MSSHDELLTQKLARGDTGALAEVFDDYRDRLRNMVRLRLDPRVQGRVDASDVVQEVFLDAQRRLAEFNATDLSLLLWFRLLAGQRMVDMHRFHLRSQKRSANREAKQPDAAGPAVNSDSMVQQLVGNYSTPSRAAMRNELTGRVRVALDEMSDIDREVLSLRHFEGLSNAETAQELGISVNAASNRYVRALRHLREVLE